MENEMQNMINGPRWNADEPRVSLRLTDQCNTINVSSLTNLNNQR